MKYLNYISLLICLFTIISACDKPSDEFPVNNNCEKECIISAQEYAAEATYVFSILAASISEDCLEIKFSTSGCDADIWETDLIDANEILESFPEQRRLKLVLENPGECLAVFKKTVSFDIRNLRLGDSGEIILNLQDWDEQLRYKY